MMNNVILVLLACLVLTKTLANPNGYSIYGENENETNGDDDVDNGDKGSTSSSDDSGENGTGENGNDSDESGNGDDDMGDNRRNDDDTVVDGNEEDDNGENDYDICRQTVKAICRDKYYLTIDRCTTCGELFDDEAACVNTDFCVFDKERGVCDYTF